MLIQDVEKKFLEKIKSYKNRWDFDSRALHLVEEVGEFAEILLHYKGVKEPKKDVHDIKVALTDILDDVFALAILSDVSLQDLIEEMLKNE